MKKIIAFIFIAMLIVIVTLSMSGCGYHGAMNITPTGVIVESNKPMCIEKKIDKEGTVSYTYSSKKESGVLGDIVTILTLVN